MHFGLTRLERKLFRTDILPIAFGFLFGLSVVLPVNIPIPTKIATTLVLPPIDIVARFGAHPACAEVGRGCAIRDAVSSDSTGAQAPTADHRLTPHQRNHSGPSAADSILDSSADRAGRHTFLAGANARQHPHQQCGEVSVPVALLGTMPAHNGRRQD